MTGVWKQSLIDYMTLLRCAGDEGGLNTLQFQDDYKVHKSQAVKESIPSSKYISKQYLPDESISV